MIKRALLTTVMVIGITVSAQAADKWKIIHTGTLLSDARNDAKSEQSIIIKNKKIVDVRNGYVSASSVDGASGA
ncbi:MAG: hypothetical protein HOH19_02310, partial [Kordiimonadaceae bacterium]|nr:hypothetical protein [Kordiimonadaceae bacterium]